VFEALLGNVNERGMLLLLPILETGEGGHAQCPSRQPGGVALTCCPPDVCLLQCWRQRLLLLPGCCLL
jgi:hypothetical protein